MRQYHRKLKNLERGYFYRTRYIGKQNIAADSHSCQQAPFCLKRRLFRHLNRRLFRYDSIAFSIHLLAYVARRMPLSGRKVLTALIRPIVPMEIRSS